MLAVTNASGTPLREYIYNGNQLTGFVSGGTLYYVHNDHLGTPQVVTNPSQAVVWMADYQPFGKLTPGQTNSIELYSRLPGQYVDGETGLYYNYFRDYDPSIGRYIESDPIGLAGGINTYAYVGGNPISYFDFFGLKAGDVYGTQHQAACDALSDIYSDSINNNIEYAGVIYQLGPNKYSYTKGTEGTAHASTPYKGNMSIYNSIKATYHSHGDSHWWENYDDENFSPTDINNADKYEHDSYLITPDQSMKYYHHNKFRDSAPNVEGLSCGCQK